MSDYHAEETKFGRGVATVIYGMISLIIIFVVAILGMTYYEGVLRDRYVGQTVAVDERLTATVVAVNERYLTVVWMSNGGLTVSEIHIKDFDALIAS